MGRVFLGLLGVAALGLGAAACDDAYKIIGTQATFTPREPCPAGTIDDGYGCAAIDPNTGRPDTQIPPGSNPTFLIAGDVEGLEGSGLTISVNGQNFPINDIGGFSVGARVPNGTRYDVQIVTQPTSPSQTCVISGNQGVIQGANANILIQCQRNPFSVGGTLVGLTTGTVTLTNRDTDATTFDSTQNGPFTFASRVPSGAQYNVQVAETTGGARCTVESGTGKVGNSAVTGVVVNCSVDKHTVGGTVTGLVDRLTLRNGGQTVTVTQDGSFTFPIPLDVGTPYSVTIATQAQGQLCSVAAGQGTVGLQSVTSVRVTCTPLQKHQVHVAVSGLEAGSNGVVIDNLGDRQTATTNGTYDYAPVINGTAYSIRLTSPTSPAQTCAVVGGNADGNVFGGDVTVNVVCQPSGNPQPQQHRIAVQVNGLDTTQMTGVVGGEHFIELTNTTANGAETRTRTTDGEVQFSAQNDGSDYAISITHQPTNPDQLCTLSSPSSGQTAAGIVVVATCAPVVPVKRTIKVHVTGITAGSVDGATVHVTGGQQFNAKSDQDQTFTNLSGTAYNITVDNPQNPAETCTVTGRNGAAIAGTINSDIEVDVMCAPTGGAKHALNIRVDGHGGALPSFHITNQSNGDVISIDSDGVTQISSLANGEPYDIDIESHAGEQCFAQFQNPGTMGDQDRELVVVCNANQ